MLIEGGGIGLHYYSIERPFIDWFDRCYITGISFVDIEKQLPYIQKYYDEMVTKNLNYVEIKYDNKTLSNLFKKWVNYKQ